jgi:uncharacterized membrane protein
MRSQLSLRSTPHIIVRRALQRAVSKATSGIAQPGTLILITLAIALWVTINLTLPEFGRAGLDPFPFPLLGTIVSTIGLYLAAMILMTQSTTMRWLRAGSR